LRYAARREMRGTLDRVMTKHGITAQNLMTHGAASHIANLRARSSSHLHRVTLIDILSLRYYAVSYIYFEIAIRPITSITHGVDEVLFLSSMLDINKILSSMLSGLGSSTHGILHTENTERELQWP